MRIIIGTVGQLSILVAVKWNGSAVCRSRHGQRSATKVCDHVVTRTADSRRVVWAPGSVQVEKGHCLTLTLSRTYGLVSLVLVQIITGLNRLPKEKIKLDFFIFLQNYLYNLAEIEKVFCSNF